MAQEQPSSTKRGLLKTIGAAGTVAAAGCIGGDSSTQRSEDDLAEVNKTDVENESKSPADDSSDSSGQRDKSKREENIRNGIPENGLGAYTDQMLEAGPVQETKTQQINQALEGTNNLEDERNALAQTLTPGNYTLLMSEYHRQKGTNGDTENQVVVNQNWSFTSDSEPILELYNVKNGNLQSQPVIVDANHTNQRKINKPGTEKPQYLAGIRDSTNGTRTVPEDYEANEELWEFYREYEDNPEELIEKSREVTQDKMSCVIFGVGPKENFIFYDGGSANSVANGKFEDSKEGIEAFVNLSNSLPEEEGYGEKVWTSAEYTESGWEFRTHSDWELGQKLPGEQ